MSVIETMSMVPSRGLYDWIGTDGVLHIGETAKSVLVTSSGDFSALQGYPPGTIAYTAGYVDMWMLDNGGDWVRFAGEDAENA